MAITYKKAGVDITEIKKSQRAIGRLIESTHNLQKMAKMTHGFGHYAGIVEIPGGKLLATHTDGVGTKVIISNLLKKYDTIGIDCIAMNVNDIICIGATPISFVDYIAANKNDQRIFKQIVSGLVKGAKKSSMPIVGGETAIMSVDASAVVRSRSLRVMRKKSEAHAAPASEESRVKAAAASGTTVRSTLAAWERLVGVGKVSSGS